MNEKVLKFAKLLVEHVRDKAIWSCDGILRTLDKENQSVIGKRWLKARSSGDQKEFLQMIIADSVDDAIFHLLFAIDEGLLPISFDGVDLSVAGESEMAGFYVGSDGWRKQFSSERYIDDYKDL